MTIFELPSRLDFSVNTSDKNIRTHEIIKDKHINLKEIRPMALP